MRDKGDPKGLVLLSDIFKVAREHGLEDSRALQIFQKWLKQVQCRIEKIDTPVARIKLEITCAEIYIEIDMPENAAECFHDAQYQARQERLPAIALDLERALQTI